MAPTTNIASSTPLWERLRYYAVVTVVGGAASYPLGELKLPGPVGSVAIDAVPGYFFAAYLNPIVGGLVGLLGHLASAASAGFPLGPVHLFVALQMFLWCLVFGLISRAINKHWGMLVAGALAVFLNGAVGPWMVVKLGWFDASMLKPLVAFLLFASFVNVLLASLAVVGLSSRR